MSKNQLETGSLSIVIPAFNEQERLGPTLQAVAELCAENHWEIEVIVVDDGSTDDTLAVAQGHLGVFPRSQCISSPENRGKGHAVRMGMLAATSSLRIFMDADGSTALNEIGNFIGEASKRSGEFILIGSIALDSTKVTPQPWYRQVAGRLANLAIRALVLPGIMDSQRGFKLFTSEAADAVFSRCTIDGWLFDVEALALARALKYPIAELPVEWEHREASRVSASSYVATFTDLLRVRNRLRSGRYDIPAKTVRSNGTPELR